MTNFEASALRQLGHLLKNENYRFTSITPESHRRVLEREQKAPSYDEHSNEWSRDLFGWSREVPKASIPEDLFRLLQEAGVGSVSNSLVKSSVRFSTIEDLLFVHSAFPTNEEDAVFFGPDSYRFVRFLGERARPAKRVLDIGAGSGVGGLCLAKIFENRFQSRVEELYLTDINDRALIFSKINCAINNFDQAIILRSDLFQQVPKGIALITANPPFMIDDSNRKYRDGGGGFGTQLSVEIAKASLNYLKDEGGQFLLYTGAPIVRGQDILLETLKPILENEKFEYSYGEIDPDLYGEELSKPAYAQVERISGVGLSVTVKS